MQSKENLTLNKYREDRNPCRVGSQLQESKMLRANCSTSAWAGQGRAPKTAQTFLGRAIGCSRTILFLPLRAVKPVKLAHNASKQAGALLASRTQINGLAPLIAACLLPLVGD